MTHRFTYGLAAVPIATAMLGSMPAQAKNDNFELVSTIAVVNALPNAAPNTPEQVVNSAEIYLIDPDGGNPRRLTDNNVFDGGVAMAPDGKKILFESNRNIPGLPINTSALFLMKNDGRGQTFLTQGSSATWSPDSKNIAFQASVSGTGLPISPTPGAPTSDSDIFVANVGDLLDGADTPRNITNTPDQIDDDADWSPDGHTLVFTRLDVDDLDNRQSVEIYKLDMDGTGAPQRLTFNTYQERAADFSPDGTRLAFMCQIGDPANPPPAPQVKTFELCVMNADGTGEPQRLTTNTVGDLGPYWSPDGQQIVFQRSVGGGRNQLFVINADGTGTTTQITGVASDDVPQGWNGVGGWNLLRVKVDS